MATGTVTALKAPGRRGRRGGGAQVAQAGTTEHALIVMVVLEVLGLVVLRRFFRTAHGG